MATTEQQQARINEINAALREHAAGKKALGGVERRALASELADLLLSPALADGNSAAPAPRPAAEDAGVPAELARFADRIDGLLRAYRWDPGDRRVLSGLHGDALRRLPDGSYVAPLRVQESGQRPRAMLPPAVSRALSDPHSSAEARTAALADLETAMGVSGSGAGDQAA